MITPVGEVKARTGDFTVGDGTPGPLTMGLREALLDIQHGRVRRHPRLAAPGRLSGGPTCCAGGAWRRPRAISGRTVVTIGMYDGVHRGHQQLIGTAVARARAMGRPCLLLTFDPHPAEVVRPGSHPAILTSLDRKAELVAGLGVDAMCVLPFTAEFMRLSPETFTHTVLVEHLHAAQVVVGENFSYGHRPPATWRR